MGRDEADKVIDKNVSDFAQIVIDKYSEPSKRSGGFKMLVCAMVNQTQVMNITGKDIHIVKHYEENYTQVTGNPGGGIFRYDPVTRELVGFGE